MLPCHYHAFQRTDCPLPPFLSVFSPTLGLACLLRFEKISFPSTSNGRCSSSFFLDLHQTTLFPYTTLFRSSKKLQALRLILHLQPRPLRLLSRRKSRRRRHHPVQCLLQLVVARLHLSLVLGLTALSAAFSFSSQIIISCSHFALLV